MEHGAWNIEHGDSPGFRGVQVAGLCGKGVSGFVFQ